MALTTAQLVTQLYVGFYNRAPDPEGLNYWIGRVNAGVSLADIANSFAASPEAISTYPYLALPNVVSPESFLNSIYLNLFGRPIDTGAGSGLEYYSAMLASGVRPGEVLAKIQLNANTNEGTADQAYLANKVAVGLSWAETAANTPGFEYNAAAAGSANSILAGVTDDPSTVTAAEAQIDVFFDNLGLPSQDLTVRADNLVGSNVDSVFTANLGQNPTTLATVQTLTDIDIITGGSGKETLTAELIDGTAAGIGPRITGVETIQLTAYAGAALSLARSTGYETIRNINSLADLTVFGAKTVADLEIINVVGQDTELSYDNIVVAEQNVSMNSASGNVDITGVDGQIGTLNLDVVGGVGVYLENFAASAENLVISGSGVLSISGNNLFAGLVDLDASAYTGDLSIDVSGSIVLTDVLTGEGDDVVTVDAGTMDADLSVDLGDGNNTLYLANIVSGETITALNFANVTNVQTLELSTFSLNGFDGVLDLTGFATLPTEVVFNNFFGNGNDLSIVDASADFTLSVIGSDFDTENGSLTVDGVVNLVVDATAGTDVDLDSVLSTTLETLVVNTRDDARVELSTGLDALVSVELNAGLGDDTASPDAELTIDVSADATQLAALASITLNADEDADLDLNGVVASAGTAQVERLAFAGPATGAGNISVTVPGLGITVQVPVANNDTAAQIAANVAAALNGVNGYDIVYLPGNDYVDFVREAAGTQTTAIDATSSAAGATVTDSVEVPGANGIVGTGLDALEDVNVTAGEDADVDITGIYGVFDLNVEAADDANVNVTSAAAASVVVIAGDDAYVYLDDVAAASVSVTAADFADVEVTNSLATTVSVTGKTAEVYLEDVGTTDVTVTVGSVVTYLDPAILGSADYYDNATIDIEDAADLETITVTGAGVDLDLAGDLGSLTTIDLSAVTAIVYVDASTADFGSTVTYSIGATSNDYALANDVTIVAEAAGNTREIFDFVGDNIGDVVITNFEDGTDATRDALDLSGFGINAASNLTFGEAGLGGPLVITAADGQFDGSITLVGLTLADAAGVALNNILYA